MFSYLWLFYFFLQWDNTDKTKKLLGKEALLKPGRIWNSFPIYWTRLLHPNFQNSGIILCLKETSYSLNFLTSKRQTSLDQQNLNFSVFNCQTLQRMSHTVSASLILADLTCFSKAIRMAKIYFKLGNFYFLMQNQFLDDFF